MKMLIIIFLLIISSITILIFVLNIITKKQLITEVEINASKEEVWNVLMDFPSFTSWNPFIKSISGTPTQGDYISVTIKSSETDSMNFKPLILVNEANQEFRWKGKLGIKGIFDGEHYFKLQEIDANTTKLIHGENFSGILSGTLLKMIGENTKKGFIAMNLALKNQVEKEFR